MVTPVLLICIGAEATWRQPPPTKNRRKRRLSVSFWCPRRDSNPHDSRRYHLKVVRLPIPPRGLVCRGPPWRAVQCLFRNLRSFLLFLDRGRRRLFRHHGRG